MQKLMKKLCAISCSSVCLFGGTSANAAQSSVNRQVYKKMRKFVNREIDNLRGSSLSLTNDSLRRQGRMGALTSYKDLGKHLRHLDVDSLREESAIAKKLGKICGVSLEVIPGLITVIGSIILASRVDLSDKKKHMLYDIRHDKNVRTISKYFGFECDCGNCECKSGNTEEKEISLSEPSDVEIFDPEDKKELESKAVQTTIRLFKILLKAQIYDLFGLLPKDVKDSFDNFRKNEAYKSSKGYYDISSMLKNHWVELGVGFGFGSIVSALFGLLGNMIVQSSMGWSEEINSVASQMESLLASYSDKKVQKINILKPSNNTKKN